MIKSQVDMNQLNQKNEKNLHRQKGKVGLGYNEEEGESSKKGAKRNKKTYMQSLWEDRSHIK